MSRLENPKRSRCTQHSARETWSTTQVNALQVVETKMKRRVQESVRSLMERLRKGELQDLDSEHGSAMVIALLIMILLMGFVTLAVTRTSNETVPSPNDAPDS